MKYSATFKSKMVRKMTGARAQSASALSKDIGVCQTTLSRWIREASKDKVTPMTKRNARRPQDWTPEQKLAALEEAASLSEQDLGAFLRRNGLHQVHLDQWRDTALSALGGKANARTNRSPSKSRRERELEKELRRKDKALAEAAALLILKKKAQAIWGDGAEST